ncbi:acyl-CoA thioesterase [Aestuariirhabdus litorea]|uniref:Thioesterase family protein n=1 Tax=Aestuariirhabdus litorea TaxID=2528527 RepID=A0A3P3VMJ6_9GAMM|nr:thioesterase family protein [Aestuariirhabdus litorea]RRJ83644.1 thioesterase family protein [Aestuariirhabdus litorea]RWW96865.1 thioesterase family protein [Endozoicomonadaceae bacterium GTF-13]
MLIDDYLALAAQQKPISITPDWGQGHTTFGGLSAALVLRAIDTQVPDERILRSVLVNFSGALRTEQECHLSTEALSVGGSISQYSGRALQNDKTVCQLSACYGIERDSGLELRPEPPQLPDPEQGQRFGYLAGITPAFVQHIDFIYSSGGLPFSNSPHNHISGWMRFSEPPATFGNAHLVALIDAWPPTVIQKLKRPCPCATVTWSLELAYPLSLLEQPLDGSEWLYYDASIRMAHHGYAHTEAMIYHPDGHLLALSSQLIAVYDKKNSP